MHDFYVDESTSLLPIDVSQLDDDLLIHNDLENPAEDILCMLSASEMDSEEEGLNSIALKCNMRLDGPGASLHLILENKIKFSLDQFIGFDHVMIDGAPTQLVATEHAFNSSRDDSYWYSAIDIKTIGEVVINQPGVTLHQPADENNLILSLGQMLEDVTSGTPCVLHCNVGGNHWISLGVVRCHDQYYLLYKDSLYNNSRAKTFIQNLAHELGMNFVVSNTCEQHDTTSCGIFALQNSRILSERLQAILGDEDALLRLIDDFRNSRINFCTQELALDLRHNEFAESYVIGKYQQARLAHEEIRLRSGIRNNHLPELTYIRELLTEALAQHDVTRQLVIDGEEVESGYEDINLEIAIDLSSEFSSRNYQYFYKLTWQDFRLSQILRDTLAELNGDVALARAGVQTNGQVLRLCALPQDHQRVVGKLAFEEVAIDDEFMVSLDDFVKTNIDTDVIGYAKVREILDRNASRYIDDYEEDTPIAPADSPRCVSKLDFQLSKEQILTILKKQKINIKVFASHVKTLEAELPCCAEIQDFFVKGINLSSKNQEMEAKSLLLMNALLDVTLNTDFEYKPKLYDLGMVVRMVIKSIKDQNQEDKIALCSNILMLAGQNQVFVADHLMLSLSKKLETGCVSQKALDNLLKFIASYASYSMDCGKVICFDILQMMSSFLPGLVKNYQLTGDIKRVFDRSLKSSVECLMDEDSTEEQKEEAREKFVLYKQISLQVEQRKSSWQNSFIDNLILLIRAVPSMDSAQELAMLLEHSPNLKVSRRDALNELAEFLEEELPEAEELIADLQQSTEAVDTNFSVAKSLDTILLELKENNPAFADWIDDIAGHYNRILALYGADSAMCPQGLNISDWQEENVESFIEHLKGFATNEAGLKEFTDEQIFELLAIIKRASILVTGKDPRDTQMLSILMMLHGQLSQDRGILLQISTGEGKSTITAVLAAVKALQGHAVDVITSSNVLARRDAEDPEKIGFFALLGLSVDHNAAMEGVGQNGTRDCYGANIVYGDVSNFQYDWIYHNFHGRGTRGDRQHDVVIVDEVDSMLIDESGKIAMISGKLAGSEFLQTIYAAMWHFTSKLDQQIVEKDDGNFLVQGRYSLDDDGEIVLNEEDGGNIYKIDITLEEFYIQRLEDYTRELLMSNKIELPSHLKQFALDQSNEWQKSLLRARSMSLEKDYVIANKDGCRIIAPVDYVATGVISTNMQWTDGVHQFLQLKHQLKLTSESLTTCYISNTHYFQLYGKKIYGMSGTLGSEDARGLLSEVYDVEILKVPTYKPKKFTELDAVITADADEHRTAIIDSVDDKLEQNRAVLIIAESIGQAKEIHKLLSDQIPASKLRLYTRADNDEVQSVETMVEMGDVIVATNLAGRGTDLKTSVDLEANGGLHVIVIYLPKNLRVEEQAFGRTSRQGNDGTAELILDKEELRSRLNKDVDLDDIDLVRGCRDKLESNRIQQARLYDIEVLALEDKLFASFVELYLHLKTEHKGGIVDCKYKLLQVEERFGFLLKLIKHANKADKEEVAKLVGGENFAAEAAQHVASLKKEAWKRFNEFKMQMMKEFTSCHQMEFKFLGRHKIVVVDTEVMRNGFLLTKAAANVAGGDNSKAMALFDRAMQIESASYSFVAKYGHAYSLISKESDAIKHKGKVKSTDYIGQALRDLADAKSHMAHFLIPNIESLSMLSTQTGETDLFNQVQTRIKLIQLYIQHIEKVQQKMANFKDKTGRGYIEITENKLLKDCFADDPPTDEINELNALGFGMVFDVGEARVPIDYGAAFLVAVLGCIQIAIGIACMYTGVGTTLGLSLVMGGVGDLTASYGICKGEAFSWDAYFTRKGVELVVAIAAVGAANIASSSGLTLFQEAGPMSLGKALAVATGVVIASKVTELAFDGLQAKLAKELVKKFEKEIKHGITKSINSDLTNPDFMRNYQILMAFDAASQSAENQYELQKAFGNVKIAEKLNVTKSVLTGFLNKLATSDTTTGAAARLISGLMSRFEMLQAISEVQGLSDEVTTEVICKAAELVKSRGKVEFFLRKNLGLIGTQTVISRSIVISLEKAGFVKLGQGTEVDQLISEKINASAEEGGIESLQLTGRAAEYTRHVIELVKKLDVARSADYSASAESFRQGLVEQTHSVVVNKLRNQVASPIVSEMMAPARAIFSESVKELYNNCCHYVSSKISKGDKSDKSSANDQGDAMARWRQEIDDVDSQKEHVMDAGAPISVVGSSGGDGSSRNTRAEQRTNHAASSTGHSEQRTSHPELVSGSNSGLGSTTPRVSAPAGRDSSSAAPRFVVVPGGARSADVDLFSFMGNNAGLSEAPKLSLDSTFYTPSDLVIGDSSVGAPSAGHYIPSTSHPVLRASHLVPYTGHAGLDPVSRATAPYLTLPALDMTSLTPSLKPVQLYSLSGGDSSSNRATGGFLDKLAKVPVPLPPMPGMEVFDSIGRDLHALRAPVGKIVYHSSKTVTTVGDFVSDAYDDLTQNYPFIKDIEPYARCGGWVAVGAGRGTLAGGLPGALAGASTGMYTCVGDKVISEVINYVAGDEIAAGIQGGMSLMSDGLESNSDIDKGLAQSTTHYVFKTISLVADVSDVAKVNPGLGKTSALSKAEASSSSVVNHYSESTSAPSGKLSRAAAEVEHEFASRDIAPESFYQKDVVKKVEMLDTEHVGNVVKHNKKLSGFSPLLPNEGEVGSYGELIKTYRSKGDNLTPHHMPSAAYMYKDHGIKPKDSIAMMMEHPHPGSGGRHRETASYGKQPNLGADPRLELAKDILDARTIYIQDAVYTAIIRDSLREVIKQNKQKFPKVFEKK